MTVFNPQIVASRINRAIALHAKQQTGTVKPENHLAPEWHRRTRGPIHRKQMPCQRYEIRVFGVDIVDVTPQTPIPRKPRNRRNRWGERSKNWRRKDLSHKLRDKDVKEIGPKARPVQYRKNMERTAQALLEWREDVEILIRGRGK